MQGAAIQAHEIVFLILLVCVVLFAVLARKLQTPYPIVLVIAGLLLSFVPSIPKVSLNPAIVFFVFLPPLLYSAAWLTSWRDFKFNFVSIFMLAVGLVAFTTAGVAGSAHWVIASFDWRLGFVLGAVVATTDAIAATAIARKIGLPKQIVDVLEGESLLNDATGLVALEFGVAIVVNGQTPTVGEGFLRLIYLSLVGIGIGLLIALITAWVEERIEDGPIEIALSIIVPYTAYLAAEAIHSSGVLAVIACGLYLSRKSSQFFSPKVRMQAWAVWDALTFVLNGLVFVIIGLQLPYVLAEIHEHSMKELLVYGAAFSGLLIALRLLWMFPGAAVAYFIRRKLLHQDIIFPSPRRIFVVGWTGMRGVVSLAAALSLPTVLANGQAFPQRDMIVFLTFSVILVTLVLQGLTLPPLIRALGLAGVSGTDAEEEEARRAMIQAALEHIEKSRMNDPEGAEEVHDAVGTLYRQKLAGLTREESEANGATAKQLNRRVNLMKELLRVEREKAVQLRNEGKINDEVLRQIQYELDLSETRLELVPQRK